MRLALKRPSSQYVNLDDCIYRCDCGGEAQYVVMRQGKATGDPPPFTYLMT